MFSKAVPIAAGFTRPVVISSRTAQGECAGTIGAYTIINHEGWVLTVGQLLEIVRSQQDSARRHAGYQGNVVEFHRTPPPTSSIASKGYALSTNRAHLRCATTRCGGGWMACAWSKPG